MLQILRQGLAIAFAVRADHQPRERVHILCLTRRSVHHPTSTLKVFTLSFDVRNVVRFVRTTNYLSETTWSTVSVSRVEPAIVMIEKGELEIGRNISTAAIIEVCKEE
jgi:hypothetical protein